ncbi:hypothetical protein C8R47DRAFT_1321925 [Mycena vitilis]|nr:hypothetical protein C8R47DRAFT_1321925 [Mycena vitilis]
MEIEQNRQVQGLPVVPDVLPLELWHDIAALTPDPHLLTWLSVAPGSVARGMHDAAFSLVFRDVRLCIDANFGDVHKALARLARILERSEECRLAVRKLEIWSVCACVRYEAEVINKLALELANALPQFPRLQEFIWDNDVEIELPMHPLILETLLSANKQLQRLQIGAMDPATPQIDLAGMTKLVRLQVNYNGPPNILIPRNLQTLRVDLASPSALDGDHSETFINNASSLSKVTFTRMAVPSHFWYRESYSALHTIDLKSITPPIETGLDFSGITTLKTLHLRYIPGVQSISPWPICILTPGSLRNLALINVSAAAWGSSSVLFGVNLLSLDSLDLISIALTAEDIYQIFVPSQWNFDVNVFASPMAAPQITLSPFQLTRLKLCDGISSIVLGSSRLFPVLSTLEIRIQRGPVAIEFFNCLGSFVSRVNTLETLVIESHNPKYHRLEDAMIGSSFMPCLKAASNLRHFGFPVHILKLDHPLFHELGDALLHVPEISLTFWGWHNYEAFTELKDGFSKLSKFTKPKQFYVSTFRSGGRVSIGQTGVEKLAQQIPSLCSFFEPETMWEIQRDAFSRELQRVVCLNP